MHKKWVLVSLISIISFDAYSASLRDPREVFNEPARGGLTHVLLGLSELGVAKAVWPGLTQEEKVLAEAEKKLALTKRLPTSEVERAARRDATAMAMAAADGRNQIIPKAVLPAPNPSVPTLAEELQFLASNEPVSLEERARLIALAEQDVAEKAKDALVAAREAGYISKFVKIARIGTTVLLGLDAGSRLYVWSILDANPGLTPVGGFTAEQIKALLE